MNKNYDEKNKKDLFIKVLLPYLLGHVERCNDRDSAVKEMASLKIFPYKSDDGVKLGSLNEPGTAWYFVNSNSHDEIRADSYRVFADELFEKPYADIIKNKLRDYELAADFSDAVVIRHLLERMSEEDSYSEIWWSCAYDILKIWNQDEFNYKLSKATSNISNNKFLFLEEYCDDYLKALLQKYKVFEDIRDDRANKFFWSKLPASEKGKALMLLKEMGVPCTFTRDGFVSEHIIRFAKETRYIASFPVTKGDAEFERCMLSHKLFMERIQGEDRDALIRAIKDENANAGIVVKNIKGEFVPLSWDLYYSECDYQEADSENDLPDNADAIDDLNDYEYLHVSVREYDKDLLSTISRVHEFSEVDKDANEYEFGKDYDAISFYKWVWEYSQHYELVNCVLNFYTDDISSNNTVAGADTQFVLEVINSSKYTEADFHEAFRFDIIVDPETAFHKRDIINAISRNFSGIYCMVSGKKSRKNVKEYVDIVIKNTYTSNDIKKDIKSNSIWDNVCIVEGNEDSYAGIYVTGKTNYFSKYQDALFLWPSSDPSGYIRAIAIYIRDKFTVDVASELVDDIDWKMEYVNLVRNIRANLAFSTDTKTIEDVYRYNVTLSDIKDFGEEKRIWLGLKQRRDKFMSFEVGDASIKISSHRDFLSAKYSGRCQLCGGRIEMGEQRNYFWTYRIVKEKDNLLANSRSNLFCLCPSCHGEMQYGRYMGQNLYDVVEKAKQYSDYIEKMIESGELEDDMPCLVQEFAVEGNYNSGDEENSEGYTPDRFTDPIVCSVVVGGKQRNMVFSWEHFMRLAFIFSHYNDFDENQFGELIEYEDDRS